MNIQAVNICRRLLRDTLCHQCLEYTVEGSRPLYYLLTSIDNIHTFSFPKSYVKIKRASDLKLKTVYGGTQRRPELKAQGQKSYTREQTLEYAQSNRVHRIQTEMTLKALELLDLVTPRPDNDIAVDIGCGSGISTAVLKRNGYFVIGVDSNMHMLTICNSTSQESVRLNMFNYLPFRENSVGVIVSVSSLQWIFTQRDFPTKLNVMFSSVHRILERGGRAAIQYYPRNISEVVATVKAAEKHFANGALVVDFPHSHRGKKLFLLLLKT